MKYLTAKELLFWNSLLKDYYQREKQSFLYTLFLGISQSKKELTDSLFDMYSSKKYINFFNNSDLLLEIENGFYIGKYKDTFFEVDTEGCIYGIGKEIQNIPANIINNKIFDLDNIEELNLYFNQEYGLDYIKYINEYKYFCNSFDLEYKENLDLLNQQSEEFNQFINNLIYN